MKNKIFAFSGIGFLLILSTFFILNGITCNQAEKIAVLEKKIEILKDETTPLRFKILSKEDGKISFAVKFFDSEEKPKDINRLVQTIEGEELSFDFIVIQVNGKHLFFPNKVYSDKIAPENGIDLKSFYNKDGFPQIFYFKAIDQEFREILTQIFEDIKSDNLQEDDNYFGNMVHDIANFNEYKPDRIYKIVCHTKGGIEVVEDKTTY